MHARGVSRLVLCAATAAGVLGLGCGGGAVEAPLVPAGHMPSNEDKRAADDGTGLLARASVQFLTGPADTTPEPGFTDPPRYEAPTYNEFGGFEYGGAPGGFGGVSYANYFPNVSNMPTNRALTYEVRPLGDAGAIAGTVAWASAPADRRLASPCGEIDNPSLRLGPRNE